MGNPLAPTLADFFMGHLESQMLTNLNQSGFFPIFYCRYVDDTFCVFHQSTDSDKFLDHINSMHSNIAFTCEKVNDGVLPFLDVKIIQSEKDINFTVYRKPTFTGRLLNFKALVPKIWKRNTVISLIYRAYRLSSTWSLFHEEIINIRDILTYNNYPNWWLEKALKSFLNTVFNSNARHNHSENQSTNFHYVKVPFYGKPSVKLKRDITKLLRKLNNKKTKICFYMTRLTSYFTNKDRTIAMLQSQLVYRYNCSVEPSISYVGETRRHLVRRAQQHYSDPNSAINKHLLSCQPCKTNFFSNFKIIAKGANPIDTEVKEALLIKKFNPPLNIQQVRGKRAAVLHLF